MIGALEQFDTEKRASTVANRLNFWPVFVGLMVTQGPVTGGGVEPPPPSRRRP